MKSPLLPEKSFFTLLLSSSFVFTALLALVLTVFFIYSQWNAYQQQADAFRESFSKTYFSILDDALLQEKVHIENRIRQAQFGPLERQLTLERLREIRFGPHKNGYFFVLQLNNIQGGEDFARHLLLPLDPTQEGLPMSSALADVEGNRYRENYLQQLRATGRAEVAYWYQKPDSGFNSQKITVLYWIKSVNWIIGAGLYSEDLENVIQHELAGLKQQFLSQAALALGLTLTILLFGGLVNLHLQNKLKERFEQLKVALNASQKELENFNQRLAQEVAEKTQELENTYQRDTLTGLFNRSKLLADLEQNLPTAKPGTFILINIDNFKEFNELFGNELGDRLLLSLAQSLQTLCQSAKALYRTGGDEFLVWLEESPDNLDGLLKALHHTLTETPSDTDLHTILFNLTLVATEHLSHPLGALEMTMRYAKLKKKDTLIYSPLVDRRSDYLHNLSTTQLLKTAIAEDWVVPVFQPLLNLKTGQIDKYECLIRIQDGNALLAPHAFLDVAKKSKLYPELMHIMLRKSFAQFADNDFQFSINLSYEDIVGEEIPKTLEQLLTPQIAPRVIFEILETEGVENYEEVSTFIQKVKALGSRVAIDDYGAGYSNLEYLLKLQIDILKLDGSLIQNLPQPHAQAIVQSVVFFAKQLNITTVAEFVSSADIYEWVDKLGIDYAQGYHIGAPSTALGSLPENKAD